MWIQAALIVAVAVVLVQHLATLSRPLTYEHSWGVAGGMVQARTFQTQGFLRLRFVPIQNNPPFGDHPDAYVHWPPLLYLSMGVWFEVFGESVASAHAYALTISVLSGCALYWLTFVLYGRLAALISTLAWFTLPLSLRYSHVIFNESLGLLFSLVSMIAFFQASKRGRNGGPWVTLGITATVLAILSSWEVAFVPAGLLLGALRCHDTVRRRLALMYVYSSAATILLIFTWYAIIYPEQSLDTIQTFLYRVGLSSTYSANPFHDLALSTPAYPLLTRIKMASSHVYHMLGLLGLAALTFLSCTYAERERKSSDGAIVSVLYGLILPAVIWFPVFSNHVAIHEFEVVLLLPATVVAVGWCGSNSMRNLFSSANGRPMIRFWVFTVVGPLMLLLPLFQLFHQTVYVHRGPGRILPTIEPRAEIMQPDIYVDFGRAIHDHTPPEAVVLSPDANSVPLYYSRRHIIAGVLTEQDLAKVLPIVGRDFRGCPVYLALFSKDRGSFPKTLAAYSPSLDDQSKIIVRLN